MEEVTVGVFGITKERSNNLKEEIEGLDSRYSEVIDMRKYNSFDVEELPINNGYRGDLKEILVPKSLIDKRIKQISKEISEDFDCSDDKFYPIYLKEGAKYFAGSLGICQNNDISLKDIKGINVSSYEDAEYQGVEIDDSYMDVIENMRGKDVLIIEDMVDSGNTLKELVEEIEKRNPNRIEIACLTDKPGRDIEVPDIKYKGFKLPDKWAVGFGLDYNGDYRDLEHIAVLKDSKHN